MKLRQYQNSAVDSCFNLWKEKTSLIGRCFTGGGKTIMFAESIKRSKKRALVIAHREELIWQAREKIERVTGLKFQVEMGNYKATNKFDSDLFNPKNSGEAGVVATIQTLTAGGDGSGRMTKFLPADFDLLICDEAHHFISSSNQKALNYFLQNKNLKILGVTATPNRADEEALGQIFQEVAFDYDMDYGIKEGWLVPFDSQTVNISGLDFNGIKTILGDLHQGSLSHVMEQEKPLYGMADSIIQIAGDKRGIGFSPSVEHARRTADIFNRYRSGCAAFISGKTDKDERRKINEDFRNGKIKWIWNCGTHTEGFDDAGVEVIVPKPTKSMVLLEQMMGRGGRPHDEIAGKLGDCPSAAIRRSLISRSVKPQCLLLEYNGNRYDLATSFDILGGKVSDEALKQAKEIARKSGRPVRVNKSIEEEEKLKEEREKKKFEEIARREKLIVKSKFITEKFNPFSVLGIKAAQPRTWDVHKILTPKMREFLSKKMSLNPDNYTYTEAGQLIAEQKRRWDLGLCNPKQAKWLTSHGYSSQTKFKDAIAIMNAWKLNGWRRPVVNPIVSKIKLPTRQTAGAFINSNEPF